MRMYEDNTLKEWSRILKKKYGIQFRLYGDEKETMERWRDHLSVLLGHKFEIREDQEDTLRDWSKLIGG